MSTWGWKCQCGGCPADGTGKQRYPSYRAAAVAAKAHTKATGHPTEVVEFP